MDRYPIQDFPQSKSRLQFDRQSRRRPLAEWRWLASIGLSVLMLIGIAGGNMKVRAQDAPPAPSDQHTLYLPAVSGSNAEAVPLSGHGQWPAGRTYTVRAGDTLLDVALEMGVDLEEMSCLLSPDFTWEQPLVIGDVLTVPDTPFVCHVVQPEETLADIAGLYGVRTEVIQMEAWNQLEGAPIPGHSLRIPLAPGPDPLASTQTVGRITAPPLQPEIGPAPLPADPSFVPADWPYGSGAFAWPVYGWLTQGYRVGHSAIDIAAPLGTPITASDRGVVIRAGWSTVGYGQFVIVDHNIDYITLYAHLSEIYVEEGQVVAKGQLLGRVGSTGNSTGPHLHFEIRDFGKRVDPLALLPR